MKECLIFGTINFSTLLQHYLEKEGKIVSGFILDDEFITTDTFNNKPIYAFSKLDDLFDKNKTEIFIAIGYKRMMEIRKSAFKRCKEKGFSVPNYIHPSVLLSDATMGEGNIILENAFLGPGTKIGDGNVIWNGTNLSHGVTMGDFNFIAGGAFIGGEVVIKNRCFVGISSIVTSDKTLEDLTLIGAGALVNFNTKPEEVILPPRSIRVEDRKSLDIF